jgi:uncharacterized protein YndB with AHSA1/START domain
MTNETLPTAEKNEVLITRIINAPRQLVYDCWTQLDHLKRWYAPNNCTCVFTKMDVKIGGGYHGAIIHTGDGRKNWFYAVFKEIDPPNKLVFTLARADEHGNHLSPKDAGMPHEWPEITLVTLTFEDLGKQTRFTLHQTVDLDLATRHGAYPSWLQMLDRMETLIVENVLAG